MTDVLKQLLRDADIGPAPAPPDLARRIRRQHTLRRAMRTTALAMLLLAAVVWPAVTIMRSRPIAIAPTPVPVASLAPTLDERIHELTAERLLAAPRFVAKPRATDSTLDLQHQRDRAALILVYEADRYLRDHRPADAMASYRRAIELFPQTHWADVARRKLAEIQT